MARLEEIITHAGRTHYANVANEAGHLVDAADANTLLSRNTETVSRKSDVQSESGDQASAPPVISDQDDTHGGLTGFSSVLGEDHESNLLLGDHQHQLRESAPAVPSRHPTRCDDQPAPARNR